MALSNDDRIWLQGEFRELRARHDNLSEKVDARFRDHSKRIGEVDVSAIKAVSDHKKEDHDPAKKWSLWASMVTVAGSVGAFFAWVFSKSGGDR